MSKVNLAVSGGWTPEMWLWLVVPIGIYCGVSLSLFVAGHSDEPDNFVGFFFREISDSLRRATGFPGWAMAGALTGLLFLGIAVMGFYWDVAWHFDLGRDKDLFTPAHVMILTGLGGLFFAAMVTVLFASVEKVQTRVHIGWLRLPLPAILLGLFGFGGVAAFPLDALWHDAYGIDVTLWSPTHLQLMAGGALATLAVWLLIAEAAPDHDSTLRPTPLGSGIHALAGGAALTGLTIFQGEFDFGAPQFQIVFLPILIAAVAGIVLVLARLAMGRSGAVKAVVAYLVLRGLLGLMVGEALGHTFPRFPLYLPSALVVEATAAWLGTDRRLKFGAVSGALIGSVGLVVEMAWIATIGWRATLPPTTLVEGLVLGMLAGTAGGVLGAGLGRAFVPAGEEPSAPTPVPIAALAAAGLVLIAALAVPLPRRVGHVDGVVALERTGAATASSPEGTASSLEGRVLVDVTLRPADAAEHAIVFTVTSWQGGGTVNAGLHRIGPGHYRTTTAVPVTGAWKSVVTLERGDQVMAAPIYLPADPDIGAPAIPALAQRDVTFVRNTTLLLREQHPGPAWPALLAYTGLALLLIAWVAVIAFTVTRIGAGADGTPPAGGGRRSGPGRPDRAGAGTTVHPPGTQGVASGWYASSGSPSG